MKIAIVTGASSGMGKEFVKQISRLYTGLDEIWVIARRRERLTQLQEESMYPLRTLDGDITDPKFLEEFAYLLQATSPDVRMLVNAAGVGSNGTIADLAEINDRLQPEMVRLNCEALLEMTPTRSLQAGSAPRIATTVNRFSLVPVWMIPSARIARTRANEISVFMISTFS